MTWAIYRIHYGTDFIKNSIKSIINDVDKIFIFYSVKPWIKTKTIFYKKRSIKFPKNPENVKKFLKENFSNNKKIIINNFECTSPKNQFGLLYNKAVEITKQKPKLLLFMEPDMIFGKNQIKLLKIEFFLKFWLKYLIVKQIEIWKYDMKSKNNHTYRIPLRSKRIGPVLWRINKKVNSINTNFGGEPFNNKKKFSHFVSILNLGFSFNKKTMFYKHLMALTFSKKIGDSLPDEDWYETKWLNWKKNSENLEISKGSQHLIKKAYKYKIPYKYYQYLV